jgi:hypothetical protein
MAFLVFQFLGREGLHWLSNPGSLASMGKLDQAWRWFLFLGDTYGVCFRGNDAQNSMQDRLLGVLLLFLDQPYDP